MWNEKTKKLVADDKLVVLGVVQEQHADRAQLYKQWKQYEFPIAQDAITQLGLAVVPVPVLIDEYGFVLDARPQLNNIEALTAIRSDAPSNAAAKQNPKHATVAWLKTNLENDRTISNVCALADANLHAGTLDSIRRAIQLYRSALSADPETELRGQLNFRLGVAYRFLYDHPDAKSRDPNDFSFAVEYWTNALAENPNQYIWRRRIQQYGPRQNKPYPFYDWVEQAQKEIADRGASHILFTTPLSGAEVARPNKRFESVSTEEINPDPEAKISPDEDGLIKIHATVVPSTVLPGTTVRVHLQFDPVNGKWNNEADGMVVWIEESDSGRRSSSRLFHAKSNEPTTQETRTIEFEFQTNKTVSVDIKVNGYALYYVCNEDDGQCLYRRQDFVIPIRVTKANR